MRWIHLTFAISSDIRWNAVEWHRKYIGCRNSFDPSHSRFSRGIEQSSHREWIWLLDASFMPFV